MGPFVFEGCGWTHCKEGAKPPINALKPSFEAMTHPVPLSTFLTQRRVATLGNPGLKGMAEQRFLEWMQVLGPTEARWLAGLPPPPWGPLWLEKSLPTAVGRGADPPPSGWDPKPCWVHNGNMCPPCGCRLDVWTDGGVPTCLVCPGGGIGAPQPLEHGPWTWDWRADGGRRRSQDLGRKMHFLQGKVFILQLYLYAFVLYFEIS